MQILDSRLFVATLIAAACSACSPNDVSDRTLAFGGKTDDVVARGASLDCQSLFSPRPTLHFLQINQRGEYAPVAFELPKDTPCTGDHRDRQIGADPDQPGEASPACPKTKRLEHQDALLNCQLDVMLDALAAFVADASARKQTPFLYIYIHGGLNDAKSRKERAEHDVPLMMLDCPGTPGAASCPARGTGTNEAYFPIYIAWPSGGWDTYKDGIANYDQGYWDSFRIGWLLRLVSDLGDVVTHAPLNYLKSLRRVVDASDPSSLGADGVKSETFGCAGLETTNTHVPFNCEQSRMNAQDTLAGTKYALTFPVRVLSVPFVDPLGKTAWDSMIARTRFAFRKPGRAWDGTDMEETAKREGVVVTLFQKLTEKFSCTTAAHASQPRCTSPLYVRLAGHSMGAIVASEIVREFPDLLYDAIVFMGAAVSIREFQNSVEPHLVRTHRAGGCTPEKGPRFFSLSLHPEAEALERFAGGLTTSGSLLEWIDDMYEKPGDLFDLRLGKWRNVVSASDAFDRNASPCIYLKRFGRNWQSPLVHSGFDDVRTCSIRAANRVAPEKRFVRPFYWEHEFWRVSPELESRASAVPGIVRLSISSGQPPQEWEYWRPLSKNEDVDEGRICVDDKTGVKLIAVRLAS